MRNAAFPALLLFFSACALESPTVAQAPGDGPGDDGGTASTGADGGVASGGDGALPSDGCTNGEALCVDHATSRVCENGRWVTHSCGSGAGCSKGTCTPLACSDECVLGTTNAKGQTCAAFDVGSGAFVDAAPATSLHDRARAYEAWLQGHHLTFGGVGSAHFSDAPAYTHVDRMDGIGDSALWTGTYLASEALRLLATGASDARANVLQLVDTVHRFFRVSGEGGVLARFVRPAGADPGYALPDVDCSGGSWRVHCGTSWNGKSWDYVGGISRDQYQGVVLGYALAYDALTSADEPARKIIRDDMLAFVRELMTERQVKVSLTYGSATLPVKTIPMRYVVLSPSEMLNGTVTITIRQAGSNEDKAAGMRGIQEFTPDLADIVKPLVGFSAPIPRASSAVMLASFFQVAMHMTEGTPDRAAIAAYYAQHAGEILDVVKQWSSDSTSCGGGYYANNITMEPMYDLARLEADPARAAIVKDDVLGSKMWPAFEHTKNPFFSFIYASNASSPPPASVVSDAMTQLAQFGAPPRVRFPVDLRNDAKYQPHDASCADQTSHDTAVDVGERPVGDFMWQRQPWSLYDPGDLAQGEPGVDYLVAYWMARRHAFANDDTPTRCLVWR